MELLNQNVFSTKFQDSFTVNKHEVTVGDKISEGGYAVVYKAIDSHSGKMLALKKIFLKDKETEEVMKKEVKIWRDLHDHPNIVKYIDATLHKTK